MHLSQIDASLRYEVMGPSHLCFHLEAAQVPGQRIVSESLEITPRLELRRYCDAITGNRFLRFDAHKGPLQVRYRAEVERDVTPRPRRLAEAPVTEVPDEVLPYMMPTRYCQSDILGRATQQMFGTTPPGMARVQAISDWIHDNIVYAPGSTDSTSTSQEVFVQRAGVCRDFAHLGVTFCRALNIPARLVVGYVWFDEPPQDFHAVFEAWLGGRWVLFDPTRMAPVDRLVRVGTGRDAKDVAFCTFFGPVAMLDKQLLVREYQASKPRTRNEALARKIPVKRVALMA